MTRLESDGTFAAPQAPAWHCHCSDTKCHVCPLRGSPVRAALKSVACQAALLASIFLLAGSARASAQVHVGVGVGVHTHPGPTHVVVGSGFYYPFGFYDPWYGPWYSPWYGPWYGYYGPWGYPPYPYPYYHYDPGASLRLEVKPQDAEVYVDGYFAGVVDDFDGVFQRLPVTPGEHDIELYLDGYRSVHQKVTASRRNTLKLKYVMEKLGPGEQQEPRPQPPNPPPGTVETYQAQPPQPGVPQAGPPQPMPPQSRAPGRRLPPPPAQPPGPARSPEASDYGTLAIRVQPADADVVIDGEKWHGPESQDRLIVDVAEGRHTVEIQKAGYRTYVTEVQVRRGDTTTLNVSMRTQNER
jgi:PEGA domain-containing protein